MTVSTKREVTGTQSLARAKGSEDHVGCEESRESRYEGRLLSCLQRSVEKAISVQNGKSPLHVSLRETDATSSGTIMSSCHS